MRLKSTAATVSLLALAACATSPASAPVAAASREAPASAIDALSGYYARAGVSLPVAPPMANLPAADATITRVFVGSCRNEEAPAPIVDTMTAQGADLFLYVGDNVYGDMVGGNAELPELVKAFADLAEQADFQRLVAKIPTLVTWDDHDYGLNDAGGDFVAKEWGERIHETFWGVAAGDAASRPGVYHAQTFGPEGRRVQVINLDTRFFRSKLTDTDQRNAPGRERYIPSAAADQDMLGEAQWAWLAAELQKPADVRLIVSSIQVLADGHGYEAWRTLPAEQTRFYETLRASGADGIVLLSGDRHLAALYKQDGLVGYPLHELTASSLNMSFRATNEEMSTNQVGAAYSLVNYGEVAINWDAGEIALRIRGLEGNVEREQTVKLADLQG
jgi:alkaline phosphatase D